MTIKKFSKVHAICRIIRGIDKKCLQCPASETLSSGERGQRMCYGMAVEAINIAKHGNPWGKRALSKNIKKWRSRINAE